MAKTASINIAINTQSAIKNISELDNELNGTISTVQDLKMASESLSKELESTEMGTEKFNNLSKALVDVNTKIKNYELSIESLDNEKLASEMKGLVGGLMDVAGGFTLLGVSGKSMEKIAQTFAKIEGISKMATGALESYNAGMKVMKALSTAASVAHAAMTATIAAEGNASLVASVKMRVLNLVMNANPVFLLITGITLLVGAFALFSSSTEDAKEKQEALNEATKRQIENNEKHLSGLKELDAYKKGGLNDLQKEIDLLKAKGGTDEEVYNAEKKLIDRKIESLKNAAKERHLLEYGVASEQLSWNRKDWEEYKNLTNQKRILEAEFTKNKSEEQKKQAESNKQANEKQLADNRKYREIELNESKEKESYKQEFYYKYLQQKFELAKKDSLLNKSLYYDEKRNIANSALEKLILDRKYRDEELSIILEKQKEKIKLNEEEFKSGKISLDEYWVNRTAINSEGLKNLTEQEKEYLENFKLLQKEKIESIKLNFELENKIATQSANAIKSKSNLAHLEAQKEIELINAEKIQNEEEKNLAIKDINDKYRQQEIDAIRQSLGLEQKLLEQQYIKDINNKEISSEKKDEIEAKYQADRIKLEDDANKEISNLETQAVEKTKTAYDTKFGEIMKTSEKILGATGQLISKAISDLQLLFDTQAATEQRTRDEKFYNDSEALKAQLANRLLTQEQYNEQVRLLEQKKHQEELSAKRKAFQQNKAMSIANAVMSTAQAVISAFNAGASLGPAGIVAGPVFAGVAGALGAAEIAIIASQKFTAARGGIVPGNGVSNRDSVPSLLAPGEAVINADATARFAPLLSMMNMSTGGKQLAPQLDFIQSNSNSNRVYNSENQTVRAYVVENDITSSQRRVRRYEENSSF